MWKITPLNLGVLTVTKSGLTYGRGGREKVEVPCIGWLLTNDRGTKILVDAGPCDDTQWGTKYHNPLKKEKSQRLENVLSTLGVELGNINKCILTHLHWDHAYGVLKLPNAEVIVQSDELRYAIDPFPVDWKHYETWISTKIPFFMGFYPQIKTVRGRCELDDGLEVIPLPGHSPGSQGILVETEKGKYLIAGDAINIMENWLEKIPPGLFYNLEKCYETYDKLRGMKVKILPGHDWKAFDV
ncbi:N-acyl homoserine lactonase family protein [Desulfosporosinus burensis]